MKRRTPSSREGHVDPPRQLSGGRWSCRARWYDGAGQMAQATEYGDTATEAKRRSQQRLDQELRTAAQVRAGLVVLASAPLPTFSAFAVVVADEVLPHRQRADQQIKTFSMLARWVEPHIGAKRLDEINAGDVRAVLARMRSAGRSRTTCNRVLSAISVVLESAVERELLAKNVARTRGLRQVEGTKQFEHLTSDEAGRLLEHADPPWRPFFAAALYTGLRFGELTALRWRDMDLERARIKVRESNGDSPKAVHERLAQIPDALRPYLPPSGPPSHLVFPRRSIKGGTFDPERDKIIQPRKALARALARAGIEKHIRFHDLRHTYGTLLVQAGVDVRMVQELLGHSTMRMTQRYVHLAAEPGDAVKGFKLGPKKG